MENLDPGSRTSERFNYFQLINVNDGTSKMNLCSDSAEEDSAPSGSKPRGETENGAFGVFDAVWWFW